MLYGSSPLTLSQNATELNVKRSPQTMQPSRAFSTYERGHKDVKKVTRVSGRGGGWWSSVPPCGLR